MRPRPLVRHAVLVLGAVLALFPLAWMVLASLMPTGQATQLPVRVLPDPPTMAQYTTLFERLAMGRYLLNSLLVATLVTGASLLVNALAGYAFAKLRFAGRERLFSLLLALLVVPAQVTMLPLFLMLREMHLVNTYAGVAIPGLASVFGIFLIRQYALSIPDELLDAARMDGASELRTFRSIVLPVLMPILVTLGIFTFMATWNDFLWPLIILSDDARYTLPVALAGLSGEHVQDIELMMAGAVVTVLPVMVVFLFLQRYYLQGIMLGSVKG